MPENKLRALKLLSNLSVVEERDLLVEENKKLRQLATRRQKGSLFLSFSLLSFGSIFGLIIAQTLPHMGYILPLIYIIIVLFAAANIGVFIFASFITVQVFLAMDDLRNRNARYRRR